MNLPRTFALASLLIFHAAPTLAQAQSPVPVRTLKSRCIGFQTDQALPQLFAHAVTAPPEAVGTPVAVKSYLNHEAESLMVSGAEILFTSAADRASIKDKLVARLKVPATLRTAILMFLPGDGRPGSPPCRILPIDDSLGAFPRGSLKVINLSQAPLRIELEKKPFDFKSGETRLIEDPPVGDANASAMRSFSFRDGEWRKVAAGNWPHPGQKRVLQVAFDNAASGSVEMRGIRDIAVRDNGTP